MLRIEPQPEKNTENEGEPVTLVFPATHPDGQKYLEAAQERGDRVIAASSEASSELAREIDGLIALPYVHDESFPRCFMDLLRDRNVDRVYAPVAAVHAWLERFISARGLEVRLVGRSPIEREMDRYNRLMHKVSNYRRFIDDCADGVCALSDLEIAAVFRMASNVYGESNEHKIAAMMAIFSSAPEGDVVEIGALVGKSAAVLAFLARRHHVGNVLAIDPWKSAASTQNDAPDTVRVDMVNAWDYEILPRDFVINTLPIGLGSFNYLHEESATGFEVYRKDLSVMSQAFGRVDYRGSISVIHIDGNHDYDKVREDCALWLPLVAAGGWLILDDYLWAHGDGPHRVGDDLLATRAGDIKRAFVCGKALFVNFAPGQAAS